MPDVYGDLDSRVIVLAPTLNDGQFTKTLFESANIACEICYSMQHVYLEAKRGVGLLVLAADIVDVKDVGLLDEILADQPTWSDLPVLVLLSPTSENVLNSRPLRDAHAITYFKRPIEVVALLTAVQAGLRDRKRQFAVRQHLIERENHSQALLAADQRKDEFLAMLAHELRNPLSPLRSGIDLLSMEDGDDPHRKEVLSMMDRQLNQMVRLVDDLLDVSRITRDKLILASATVEIQAVIGASIEMIKNLLNSSHIELTSDLPLESVYVSGDFTRLTQVVSNLLNNAVKYSPAGSEIKLVVKADDEQVLVSVSDAGIGIPEAMLGRVFEMFTQVDSSITRARGGLGIGLTLVRRIVEMHGGSVSAHSDGIGRGSTFQVRLNRIRPGEASTAPSPEPGAAKPKRVLVVDDTRAARVMLSKLLRKLGHAVYEAESGREALANIQLFRPDIVISDIGMPEMDGYELARCIRQLGANGQTFLVALTGYGQESDRQRALEAGFNAHVTKPVSYSVLQRILADASASARQHS